MLFLPLGTELQNNSQICLWGIDYGTKLVTKIWVEQRQLSLFKLMEWHQFEDIKVVSDYQEYTVQSCKPFSGHIEIDIKEMLDLLSAFPTAIFNGGNHGNIIKIKKVYHCTSFSEKAELEVEFVGLPNQHYQVVLHDAKWTSFWEKCDNSKAQEEIMVAFLNRLENKYLLLEFEQTLFGGKVDTGALVTI